MTIYFATRIRGFLAHLFMNKNIKAQFVYSENQIFETNSAIRKFFLEIIHTPVSDLLGIIQVIHCNYKKYDMYGSFNRFLKTDKPYFIYVENPTALYHYSINRNKTFLGRKKVIKNLNNKNLKALIFFSNACANTFEKVCNKIHVHTIRETIYPYIPQNTHISIETIKLRAHNKEIKLLYIAQGIRFTSKGGLEIIEAFKKLRSEGYSYVSLTMITSIHDVDTFLIDTIKQIEGITLYDFTFTYKELETIYAQSTILLHPTSDDSFGLTILEAMKAGIPIITTKLYAIPELVKEGVNGLLTEPHYWFFDSRNIPNPEIWNHRKETIYASKTCDRIISFLYDSIVLLNNDRILLEKMSINSFKIANSTPFDEDTIIGQWNNIFKRIQESANSNLKCNTHPRRGRLLKCECETNSMEPQTQKYDCLSALMNTN
jgi:glycosyltransferase involved in cell wall biosynthesis